MKTYFLLFFMGTMCLVKAQILEPVKISWSSNKIDKNSYEIHLKAEIDKNWHVFSQNMEEGGPLPTLIEFNKNNNVTLQGRTKEVGKLREKYEEIFMVNTKYYYNTVDFVQLVKKKTDKPVKLEGTITYMACKEEQCLTPQEVEFEVVLNGSNPN